MTDANPRKETGRISKTNTKSVIKKSNDKSIAQRFGLCLRKVGIVNDIPEFYYLIANNLAVKEKSYVMCELFSEINHALYIYCTLDQNRNKEKCYEDFLFIQQDFQKRLVGSKGSDAISKRLKRNFSKFQEVFYKSVQNPELNQKLIQDISYLFQFQYLAHQFKKGIDFQSLCKLSYKNKLIEYNEKQPESYIEYLIFSEQLKKNLEQAQKTFGFHPNNISSFSMLAEWFIHEISSQYKLSEPDPDNCSVINASKQSLAEQYIYFEKYVNCYGERTIERFHACQKNAEKNALSAQALSDYYYFGCNIYNASYSLTIKQDIRKALECNLTCHKLLQKPTDILSSTWSIAYIYDRYYQDEKNAIKYLDECGDYAPAHNTRANIYREKVRKSLLNLHLRYGNDVDFVSIPHNNAERKAVMKYSRLAIEYYLKAIEEEYVFAYNNIIALLCSNNKDVVSIRRELSTGPSAIIKYINILELFKKGESLGNSWLHNKFGIYIMQHLDSIGNSIENPRAKAKSLFETALHNKYYPAATNLAVYFYPNNPDKYKENLLLAYQNGGIGCDPRARQLLNKLNQNYQSDNAYNNHMIK